MIYGSDPFSVKRPPPLTTGARIMRGFRRIGLALAVPTLILGLIAVALTGYGEANRQTQVSEQLNCLARLAQSGHEFRRSQYDNSIIYLSDTSCSGPQYQISVHLLPRTVMPLPDRNRIMAEHAVIWGTMVVLGAALLFLVPFVIGWILAGFTRD